MAAETGAKSSIVAKCPKCAATLRIAAKTDNPRIKCPKCATFFHPKGDPSKSGPLPAPGGGAPASDAGAASIPPSAAAAFDGSSAMGGVPPVKRPVEPEAGTISDPAVPPAPKVGNKKDEARIGTKLGPFEITGILGKGAMGIVYEARDVHLQRSVALKILPPEMMEAGPEAVERFLREARSAATLEDPNIVNIYHVGVDEGTYFIAMQLVRGCSAADRLKQSGPMGVADAVRVALCSARALAAAQSKGIVHRDIKPANIMLGEGGAVKVTDFGLAKTEDSELTNTGKVMGTPSYMSPEACRGDPTDGRSDIYSLGATLYCLLVGRPPYRGDNPPAIMFKHVYEPVPDIRAERPDVPDGVAAVLLKAMAKDPAYRYQTALEMAVDLEQLDLTGGSTIGLGRATVGVGGGTTIAPIRPIRRSWASLPGKTPYVTAAAGAGSFVLILILLILILRGGAAPEQKKAAPPVEDPFAHADDGGLVRLRPDPPEQTDPPTRTNPPDKSEPPTKAEPPAKTQPPPIASNWSRPREKYVLEGHAGPIVHLAFSPDSKRLATGSVDKTVRFWDMDGGKRITTLQAHGLFVTSVAFSPDGKLLATGSYDVSVKIWDTAGFREKHTLQGHANPVRCVAFSPDGRTLVSGGIDTVLVYWDPEDGRRLAITTAHSKTVRTAAFSPNGRTLASGGEDNVVRLWDPLTRRQLATLDGHTQAVFTLAWSPDGALIATGSEDSTVRLWTADTARHKLTLTGHTGIVTAVAFSPDGRTLVSTAGDETVKLWDVSTGRLLTTLENHKGQVSTAAFSRDGRLLATGGFDRTARIWEPGE